MAKKKKNNGVEWEQKPLTVFPYFRSQARFSCMCRPDSTKLAHSTIRLSRFITDCAIDPVNLSPASFFTLYGYTVLPSDISKLLQIRLRGGTDPRPHLDFPVPARRMVALVGLLGAASCLRKRTQLTICLHVLVPDGRRRLLCCARARKLALHPCDTRAHCYPCLSYHTNHRITVAEMN